MYSTMKGALYFSPPKQVATWSPGGEMNICFDIPTSYYSSVYFSVQFKMKILVVWPIPLPRRAATEVACPRDDKVLEQSS